MKQTLRMYAIRAKAGLAAATLFVALVASTMVNVPSVFAGGMAGAGTSASPYLVTSCLEFEAVPNDNAAYYRLTQSTDCSADGAGVMDPSAFSGSFDGGSHTITVDIDSSDQFVGLFTQLDGATVSNLTVDGSVQSSSGSGVDVGSLSGQMNNSTIDHVTIAATTTLLYNSSGYTGGLAGYMLGSTVNHTAVTNDVLSYTTVAGGLFRLYWLRRQYFGQLFKRQCELER